MGDLIIVCVKSPSIPVQGVLGDYIDRCIKVSLYTHTLPWLYAVRGNWQHNYFILSMFVGGVT